MYRNKKPVQAFFRDGIRRADVLVVGDAMLDRYYFGEVKRISPEAPVPVTRVLREKETLGGAANVAHNLARLDVRTRLAGSLGDDAHGRAMQKLLDDLAIRRDGLVIKDGPTTTKLRVIGGHQQMLRLDFEETGALAPALEAKLTAYIEAALADDVGGVIISDYAKGVCTPSLCRFVIQACRSRGVPVVVDPKGGDWRKYEGADYITPNLKELNEAVGGPVANEDEAVQQAARAARRKYKIRRVVATRSERGLSLVDARRAVHIPTLAQEVFDVSGAGDTVIAVLGAALAGRLDGADAAYVANLAAGVVVGKVGTYAISRQELLRVL